MDSDEKRQKAIDYINGALATFPEDSATDRKLAEAVHTYNELGLWGFDCEFKDNEDVIRIWALVESVRLRGFPEELRM